MRTPPTSRHDEGRDPAPWTDATVERSVAALHAVADPSRAAPMAAYMKHIAPFLGVPAPERRAALRSAWAGIAPPPTPDALGAAARRLMAEPERELHYAAYDLLDRHLEVADEGFCARHVEDLLLTTPWWDTVDGLVSAAVSPLCRRYRLDDLVDAWSESGDRWLVRAALGHQRGWKRYTDVERVLALCSRHWADPEFFVAKAIGWALRDLARIDPDAVAAFLEQHPARNTVARREAERGLHRAGGRHPTSALADSSAVPPDA
jgi:3-methyladenine DNA glycosylase AlkD